MILYINKKFGKLNIPIFTGILPLASVRHAIFLNQEVPGITIPKELIARMDRSGDNSASIGIKIAIELIDKIRPHTQGIYIMPAFNRYDFVAEIIDAVRTKSS